MSELIYYFLRSIFLIPTLYLHTYRFAFSWQPESKFPFSQVFLPPKDTGKHTEFVENQEVEVFARSNEKEACGWWTANIKVLNYNVITYHVKTFFYQVNKQNVYTFECLPSNKLILIAILLCNFSEQIKKE